ncbi:glycosyltransferase family 4 protein [Candidatus Margulisiibacteriota bacterium]
MKIAFFSESYKPYLSGVTNSVETLANELESLGHEVYIFAPDYPGAERSDKIYRFPSIKAPYPGYRLAIPKPRDTLKMLKEKKIELIHSHSPYQLGLMSMWCAKKLRIPFVFTMHTLFDKYMHYVPILPQELKEKFISGYLKGFANRCDAVIVPTHKAMENLRSKGTVREIEVIPTGVNLNLFKGLKPAQVKKKYKIPSTAKILLYVGRLAEEKNLPFLLRSFKLILNKVKNIRLLIVAGGPMESELKEEAANLDIFEKTIFTGEVSYPEVLNYYAAADLFVFSSLTETQGLVLPEAMAAGLPVVAVNSEGVANMVKEGESGSLVEPNEHLFSEKVIDLLSSKERLLKLRAKTKKYAQRYSSGNFAKKVEELYSSLLASNK